MRSGDFHTPCTLLVSLVKLNSAVGTNLDYLNLECQSCRPHSARSSPWFLLFSDFFTNSAQISLFWT